MTRGGACLELIEAIGAESTVASAKPGIAHICYQVDDLESKLSEVRDNRIGVIFTKILTAPALDNGKIAFVYCKNGTVLEFYQSKE